MRVQRSCPPHTPLCYTGLEGSLPISVSRSTSGCRTASDLLGSGRPGIYLAYERLNPGGEQLEPRF